MKPYPLLRDCFTCGHRHPLGLSCDDARRLRIAQGIVDWFLIFASAAMIGLIVTIGFTCV